MEYKKEIYKLLILLVILYILFNYYISNNHVIQAFTFLPFSLIVTLLYFIYYNVPLTYLFIPFITAFTIFFLLLFLHMEYQYTKYYGVMSDAQPGQIAGVILVIISIIYIVNNPKCNLSKVLMLIVLISSIQTYYYMYGEQDKE